jgi:hypothetical protein
LEETIGFFGDAEAFFGGEGSVGAFDFEAFDAALFIG